MELDDIRRDTLTELINVAFGRAASALSKLTGHRVEIEAPSVTMCEVRELAPILDAVLQGDVATVHQLFSGPVAGDALLILDEPGAVTLSRLLTTGMTRSGENDAARDVLTEVGNILLNACLGTLGNLLDVHVRFSVPRLSVATVAAMIDSVLVAREELRYALVVQAAFRLRASEVKGYLLIVLTVDSLARLLRAMRESEQGEG